jgi:hypothetical protein
MSLLKVIKPEFAGIVMRRHENVKQGKYQKAQKSKDEYDNRLAEVKS